MSRSHTRHHNPTTATAEMSRFLAPVRGFDISAFLYFEISVSRACDSEVAGFRVLGFALRYFDVSIFRVRGASTFCEFCICGFYGFIFPDSDVLRFRDSVAARPRYISIFRDSIASATWRFEISQLWRDRRRFSDISRFAIFGIRDSEVSMLTGYALGFRDV